MDELVKYTCTGEVYMPKKTIVLVDTLINSECARIDQLI